MKWITVPLFLKIIVVVFPVFSRVTFKMKDQENSLEIRLSVECTTYTVRRENLNTVISIHVLFPDPWATILCRFL